MASFLDSTNARKKIARTNGRVRTRSKIFIKNVWYRFYRWMKNTTISLRFVKKERIHTILLNMTEQNRRQKESTSNTKRIIAKDASLDWIALQKEFLTSNTNDFFALAIKKYLWIIIRTHCIIRVDLDIRVIFVIISNRSIILHILVTRSFRICMSFRNRARQKLNVCSWRNDSTFDHVEDALVNVIMCHWDRICTFSRVTLLDWVRPDIWQAGSDPRHVLKLSFRE